MSSLLQPELGGGTTILGEGSGGLPVFNVTDPLYDADNTGASDAAASIQAAMDDAPDGGAIIYMPAGRYKILSTLRIEKEGLVLMGANSGQHSGAVQAAATGSRIEIGDGFVGTDAILVQRVANDRPLYGVRLDSFTMDGRNVGAIDGVHFRSNRAFAENLQIHRMGGHGLHMHGYSVDEGADANWNTYDSIIAFCILFGNGGDNILFDLSATDMHIVHTVCGSAGANGFHMKAGSVQVTGCHFWNSALNNIYLEAAGSRSKFANCKIEGANQHGVLLESSATTGIGSVQFTNCNFKNSGDSADNTYDHFHVSGTAAITRPQVTCNSFTYDVNVSPNRPRYGVNFDNNIVQDGLIAANTFGPATHYGTGPIRDAPNSGAPTRITANINAVDNDAIGDVFAVVTDTQYAGGARGTGFTTNDDAAAIQAAIDSLTNGGVVYLPTGIYYIGTTLIIRNNNVQLLGAGQGEALDKTQGGQGTIIKVGTTVTGRAILVQRNADDRTVMAPVIRDLTIDGQLNAGPIDGILWKGVRGRVQNVGIHRMSGHGIVVTGYSGWLAEDNNFQDLAITRCTSDGLRVIDFASNCHITGCMFDANLINIYATASECQVSDCYFNNTVSRVSFVANTFNSTLSNKVRYGLNLVGSITSFALVLGNTFGPSSHFGTSAANIPTTVVSAQVLANQNVGNQAIVIDNSIQAGKGTASYSASVTPNLNNGNWLTITVTNGTAFAIAIPTNMADASHTTDFFIEILNSSGGAMGAITWTSYIFDGFTWVNPASTKKRWARFSWNGVNAVCTGVALADY